MPLNGTVHSPEHHATSHSLAKQLECSPAGVHEPLESETSGADEAGALRHGAPLLTLFLDYGTEVAREAAGLGPGLEFGDEPKDEPPAWRRALGTDITEGGAFEAWRKEKAEAFVAGELGSRPLSPNDGKGACRQADSTAQPPQPEWNNSPAFVGMASNLWAVQTMVRTDSGVMESPTASPSLGAMRRPQPRRGDRQ